MKRAIFVFIIISIFYISLFVPKTYSQNPENLYSTATPAEYRNGDEEGVRFEAGPDMNYTRMAHNVTNLSNGAVVVFGGHGSGFTSLNSAEYLLPGGEVFQTLTMLHPHDEPVFTRMNGGRYLIAGGSSDWGVPNYAFGEVYNPDDHSFTQVGTMVRFRASAGSATLANGKVLVVGAWWTHNNAHTYGELFDPETATFTETSTFSVQRSHPVVLPTDDGRAVVFGGLSPTGSWVDQPVELFNPGNGEIEVLQNLLFPGETGWHLMTHKRPYQTQRLSNGEYLFSAFRTSNGVNSYRLFTFDPSSLEIAEFITTGLPDSQTFSLIEQPIVDVVRGRSYLLAQVANSNPAEVKLITIQLENGTVEISAAGHVFGYSLYGTAITLLEDGRLFVSGGSADGSNFNPVNKTLYITPGSQPLTAPSLSAPEHEATDVSVNPSLSWQEVDGADTYTLQISTVLDFSELTVDSSGIDGPSFDINGLESNTTYYWRISAYNGNAMSEWSAVWKFTTYDVTSVGRTENGIPAQFILHQNYPNPFNPSTTIRFDLPIAANVRLEIFNMLGQKLATLIHDEKLNAGSYDIIWDAADIPGGLYIYRFRAGDYENTKKLILLK
jgi:hypothetical protein